MIIRLFHYKTLAFFRSSKIFSMSIGENDSAMRFKCTYVHFFRAKKQEKEFSKLKIMIESNQIPNFRMFEKSDITM